MSYYRQGSRSPPRDREYGEDSGEERRSHQHGHHQRRRSGGSRERSRSRSRSRSRGEHGGRRRQDADFESSGQEYGESGYGGDRRRGSQGEEEETEYRGMGRHFEQSERGGQGYGQEPFEGYADPSRGSTYQSQETRGGSYEERSSYQRHEQSYEQSHGESRSSRGYEGQEHGRSSNRQEGPDNRSAHYERPRSPGARREYTGEGGHSYRLQHKSQAEEQGGGGAVNFFSSGRGEQEQENIAEDSKAESEGGILGSFTTGLSSALHNYARDLFPATSTHKPIAAASSGLPGATTGNRFDSFATPKKGNGIKWYVDGKDYMYAVSLALEQAKETIWILDWWLSPELYLRRPPKANEQYRLDRMLGAAAERGVKINVIVYKEVTQALTLDSAHTKHTLEALHPNIAVFRHPDHLPDKNVVLSNVVDKVKSGSYQFGDAFKGLYGMKDGVELFFSHHEKLCLIDGEVAFMGGLDLCFGRWDMNHHPIADAHPKDLDAIVFPGQDYNDARFMDFQHVDKFDQNEVSRLEVPRMGWSDVALSLIGPSVNDLRTHFVQRWNFIFDEKYQVREQERYIRFDESILEQRSGGGGVREKLHHGAEKLRHPRRDYEEGEYREERVPEDRQGVECQIARSCSKWSHGTETTEHSICNAYIEIISCAKHFLYFENQFFISATDDKQNPILNKIARAIVDRIIRAHKNGEKFKVMIMIPAIPGFAGDLQVDDSLGTRAIMEFQFRSINRGHGMSIYEQLQKAGVNPTDYIRFYNLRNYDRLNSANAGEEYERGARGHDEEVGGGYGYGGYQREGRGNEEDYERYQRKAPQTGGEWDSVSKCYMLGGGDLRKVPWEGDPEKEIDSFVQEELYIHSKILIADDQVCIIGSANLNDRSQLGDHDSEIAIIVQDPTPLPSKMDGRRHMASHFAATLRRQIFRKHLGLIPAQDLINEDENMQPIPAPNLYDFDSPEDRLVEDPLCDEFQNFWNQTADVNTDAFAKVFHAIPDNRVKNWKQYDNFWGKFFAKPKDGDEKARPPVAWGHIVPSEFESGAEGARQVKEVLSRVRGTVVHMALDFLTEEDVAKEGVGLNAFTETIYT